MASLPLPRDPDVERPTAAAARDILAHFRRGDRVDRIALRTAFETAAGQSDASGAWSMREAFDALELAELLFLLDPNCPLLAGAPPEILARLEAFVRTVPVQSYRSEVQVALQQFSTPLPLAFLAGLAAGPNAGDLLLEPSAGNGLLAWSAARAGARLLLNEYDDERRSNLAAAFPDAALSGHDGELIDDLLAAELRPTLVIMNPPFARTIGRQEDRHAAGRHLMASLRRLAPGGRLVAIMPESFSSSGTGREMRDRAERHACARLDALIAPGAFARHGTGVAVRLLVFDKTEASASPVHLRVDRLDLLIEPIEKLAPRAEAGTAPLPSAARAIGLFTRRVQRLSPRPPAAATPHNSVEPLALDVLDEPAPAAEQVGIYLPYRPSRIAIPQSSEHPTPLVESVAMGSIAAPRPDHVPLLPARLLERQLLSDAQLETLVYAGSAFARDLPGRFIAIKEGCDVEPSEEGSAYRRGYFLGDGTGAGKGRQIAGVILDQWLRGNRRHIWISKNESLLEDARRDWTALGGLGLDVQPLSQWKLGSAITFDCGILFITYPALRSGRDEATRLHPAGGAPESPHRPDHAQHRPDHGRGASCRHQPHEHRGVDHRFVFGDLHRRHGRPRRPGGAGQDRPVGVRQMQPISF